MQLILFFVTLRLVEDRLYNVVSDAGQSYCIIDAALSALSKENGAS